MNTSAALHRLAVIFSGRAEASFLKGWSEEDWISLIDLANHHRLVPAVYGALEDQGLGEAMPGDVRSYFTLIANLNDERNAALGLEIQEAMEALNRAGIEPMLLKGAAALMDASGLAEGRMIGDIDLLLPPGREAEALSALGGLGFRQVRAYPAGAHSIADLDRPGNRACIDLHRELLDPPFRMLLPAAGFFARAECVERDGLRYLLPAPRDRALHALLHAQILEANYYCRRLCLRSARELVRLAPGIDWGGIEVWVTAQGLRPVLEASLLSAQDAFGMAWPLSAPATATAIRHHRRACMAEEAGRWDIGIGVTARVGEAFAADRLAVIFGTGGWYPVKVLRQCHGLLRRHAPGMLLRRLLGSAAAERASKNAGTDASSRHA
jgi:hypothetical protein